MALRCSYIQSFNQIYRRQRVIYDRKMVNRKFWIYYSNKRRRRLCFDNLTFRSILISILSTNLIKESGTFIQVKNQLKNNLILFKHQEVSIVQLMYIYHLSFKIKRYISKMKNVLLPTTIKSKPLLYTSSIQVQIILWSMLQYFLRVNQKKQIILDKKT